MPTVRGRVTCSSTNELGMFKSNTDGYMHSEILVVATRDTERSDRTESRALAASSSDPSTTHKMADICSRSASRKDK